ncbi:MAG: tetratricopeptide repeat protein [Candidatus Eisenbacteria bacterium]|nr:tetratricopeptide repeat protein [Candidatus Eisenbacteria bacterium]
MKTILTHMIALALCLTASVPLWAAGNPEPSGGWRALGEKRYADALKEADNVLSKKPKDTGAHWLAAEVTLAQKDTAASITHWRGVLESDPIHPQAMMRLVELLFARADTVGVQKILDTARQKKPGLAQQTKRDQAASSYSRLASSARSTEQQTKPDVAAFAYCQGLLFQARGQQADAMVEFSRAIENDPGQPRFYVAFARLYEEKRVLPLARENFLTALALDSTDASVHYGLASVLMDMKQYSEALAQFKKARDIDPEFPNVSYQIGKLYFYAEKYEQALQELQVALQTAKEDNFFLFSIYGQTLRALRKAEEAQVYLEKAYGLKPTELSTARSLAANSFDLRKYDRAVEVLKVITEPPKAEPTDYALLGESYYNMAVRGVDAQALYDSAAVYLKKGYELVPANNRLAYLLGMTYFNSDRYDSAIVYFDKKIQADSTSSAAYFYMGYCYLKKEMYRDAVANLRRANELDPTRASVHTMLAQTLIFADSTKAAKLEFQAAVELDPAQGDAYGGLGFLFLKEENWSSAAANLKRATELQPTNANYWLAYGQASYYMEDYGTAERAFRSALQYDPNNKDARTGLETIGKVRARKKQLQ